MNEGQELIAILCIFILGALGAVYSMLTSLSRRLSNIESSLGIETELSRANKIDPDVEDHIRRGKINQAIKLHWRRNAISARDAELIIRRHAAGLDAA